MRQIPEIFRITRCRFLAIGLCLLFVVMLAWSATAAMAAGDQAGLQSESEAEALIREFGDQSIAIIGDQELSALERIAQFRSVIAANFDLDLVSRFVLGRHWRSASEQERAAFREVFEDYLVVSYARKLETYSGESLEIGEARQINAKDTLVTSKLIRSQDDPITVAWRLRRQDGRWRIFDLVVEGVSLAVTQRSEFDALIRSGGGTVEGLIQHLRQKSASLAAPNVS